jgi:hypothetical protein
MALISLIAPLKGLGLTTGIRNNADSDTPHGGKCLVRWNKRVKRGIPLLLISRGNNSESPSTWGAARSGRSQEREKVKKQ